jgi:hypothetical protein
MKRMIPRQLFVLACMVVGGLAANSIGSNFDHATQNAIEIAGIIGGVVAGTILVSFRGGANERGKN